MKEIILWILRRWYKRRFRHFGANSSLSPRSTYLLPGRISIGDNVYIGPGAYISCNRGLTVGNGVTVGPFLLIMGGDHNFTAVGKSIHETASGGVNEPVAIEDDVWIGARVTILKGVLIREGAVIGAGSVVTRNVPPYCIYAGNPAREIGMRFSAADLDMHLKMVNSRYSVDQIEQIKANGHVPTK